MATSAEILAVDPAQWTTAVMRLGLAVIVGGIIGWEREISGKAGGLRTHMLVSLGAALFILVPLQMGAADDAVSRSIQGIATGVGFLGAGEIVHRSLESGRLKVKGLTSAASIWVTAAVGAVAGCGLWQTSLVAALITLLILVAAKYLEYFLPRGQEDR